MELSTNGRTAGGSVVRSVTVTVKNPGILQADRWWVNVIQMSLICTGGSGALGGVSWYGWYFKKTFSSYTWNTYVLSTVSLCLSLVPVTNSYILTLNEVIIRDLVEILFGDVHVLLWLWYVQLHTWGAEVWKDRATLILICSVPFHLSNIYCPFISI